MLITIAMKFRSIFHFNSLYSRFILRVLAPPFIILLALSIVGLHQLDSILHHQAIDDLKRSAATTAATLEREFTLRETVLKQTGSELFIIKSEYTESKNKLESDHAACRAFIQQKFTYVAAPNGVCEPFAAGLTDTRTSLASLENEYVKRGEELIQNQNQRINERLSAYKAFFPETLALLIIDDNKSLVSSAYSGAYPGTNDVFIADAEAALTSPIRGKMTSSETFQIATFAFQIPGGSVLAAYDVQNEHFIRQAWESAPIDKTRALAVLLDSEGNSVFPVLKNPNSFIGTVDDLHKKAFIKVNLDSVEHTAVGASAGASNWTAVVASPTAAVLSPIRDAQLAGIITIGLLIVGFLWVGTFFIRRTLRNIVSLVSGAIVFGEGKLDYKIKLDHHADGEFTQLADTMNSMAGRIATAEKAVDVKNKEFISIATHEIRSPLTAIIANLTLFRDVHEAKLDPKGKHVIDQAYSSTVRLRDLVNDMLNVAHLESGQDAATLAPVAVKPLIQNVLVSMNQVATIAKVNLMYIDTHSADIVADEQRLRIIINNFISNAIKYNRPGGHVIVSHKHKDNQLITTIQDDGLGIPEDQKTHMFEKFFRVKDDDRQGVTGTGLGMYIVKQYIEQMHGEIWFESVHGKSTSFSFSLPLAGTAVTVADEDSR